MKIPGLAEIEILRYIWVSVGCLGYTLFHYVIYRINT